MDDARTDLAEAIRKFRPEDRFTPIEKVEQDRAYLLDRYPKEKWASMSLDDYALGQEAHPVTFCGDMEFKCKSLGSISGGSSEKHIIYRNKKVGWAYAPELGDDEQQAWETVRSGFLQMFELADAGKWNEIDTIPALSVGKALRMKTLCLYYPDEVLPVNSIAHIRLFLGQLGHPLAADSSGDVVRLNRALLNELREIPETADLSHHDLMVVLYRWRDPKTSAGSDFALTQEQFEMLMQRFRQKMPGFVSFKEPGEKFPKEELDFKRAILARLEKEGLIEQVKDLVAKGQGMAALKAFSKVVTSNLVSYRSWRQSFGTSDEQCAAILNAFLEVAEKPHEKASDLAPIFKAYKEQKLKPSWDSFSTTLWALRPTDYFPVKISYYRKLAEELGSPLPSGRPGKNNFARVMEFGRAFYDALETLMPSDWVEVQSFIWCVCPEDGSAGVGRCWVFQADPKKYDLSKELLTGEPINWSINQHGDDIAKGDRVILWSTGAHSGCYALATVSSDLYEKEDDFGSQKVDLSIDLNLAETPVPKRALESVEVFKGFNGGKQGTNLAATDAQYDLLKEMGKVLQEKRTYWIYAPGDGARFWEDNQQHQIMTLGWDKLGDLDQYQNREEMHQGVIQAYGKTDPKNDSLALWQFYQEVQPGDVVIAKQGKRKYLGYGIVNGPYRFDAARSEYRQTRRVDWADVGEAKDAKGDIVLKTLTNINSYLEYIVRLKKLIGIEAPKEGNEVMEEPLNQILYGPPGTGKTFALKNTYFDRYTTWKAAQTEEQLDDGIAGELSWWEVIAMVLLDKEQAKVSDILEHRLMQARIRNATAKNHRASIWGVLQAHTKEECEHVNYKSRTGPLLFEKSADSIWSIDRKLAAEEVPDLIEQLEQWKKGPSDGVDEKRYAFTTFHQSYTYEDFIEGIKPKLSDGDIDGELGYELKEGVFKQIARRARANPTKKYALFIDEINRGNVASILGELITLIEVDKRDGAEQEMSAVLPYSRETFSVPANLDIIGTMNTADRSVEALDTALRRRFEFVEMVPDTGVIEPSEVGGVDLRKLLNTINARIERLLDKDHCIGHSYLIGLKTLKDLQNAFANKILPLLEEYFYNDAARMAMVLGPAFVEPRSDGAATVELARGPWQDDMDKERPLYTVYKPQTRSAEDFRSIYDV